MPRLYSPLPVNRLSDSQLWATLHGRLAFIEMESRSVKGRTPIAHAAHDAMRVIAELKQRGIQLSMSSTVAPFPDQLPQVTQTGLLRPRA